MLYMVEMDLADRSRMAAWHAWYEAHINKLLAVEGYRGAQRFEAMTPCQSPFLAIHEVTGADFFESAQYRAVGGPSGTGEWQAVMTNWHRNLFSGCDSLAEVTDGRCLVVVDDGARLPDELHQGVTWLENAGLDRSIARRGIVILDDVGGEDVAGRLAGREGVHVFRPISTKFS